MGTSIGDPCLWQWQLGDDIGIQIERESTGTPVHLVYLVPDNYATMHRQMAQSREARRDQDAKRQFQRI